MGGKFSKNRRSNRLNDAKHQFKFFTKLPNEIIEIIFEFVRGHGMLYNISLTCWHYNDIVRRLLHRNMTYVVESYYLNCMYLGVSTYKFEFPMGYRDVYFIKRDRLYRYHFADRSLYETRGNIETMVCKYQLTPWEHSMCTHVRAKYVPYSTNLNLNCLISPQ